MTLLTEEQLALQALAQEFASSALKPHAGEWDARSFFPIDTIKQAASLGFGGLYVKSDHGGAGLGRLDGVIIFEALSAGCVPTTAYITIHNMVAWIIDTFGNNVQRQKWLPSLVSMDHFASYCLTEPGSGSDAASLKTKAVLSGGEYTLDGEKCFISGGGVSDVYLVMARTGDSSPKGISCFLVPKDTPGIHFGVPEKKMGWKSQPTTTVSFQNCKIPVENLIGHEGEGFKIAMKALDGGRLNIAACSLGGAGFALDQAKTYIHERTQFGKKLKDFQALRFRFADLLTHLEAARLMVYSGAVALDSKAPDGIMRCAMAKKFATDMGFDIANQALQFLGGYGYIHEYGIERVVRDLRVHQILEGTNEIMQLIIAREAFGG